MNIHRRLFLAIIIALSWLFAIQAAGAVVTANYTSEAPACTSADLLPDYVPTWIQVRERAENGCIASGQATTAFAETICTDAVEALPDYVPTWIQVRERADDGCAGSGQATTAFAEAICTDAVEALPDYVPTWIQVRERADDDCVAEGAPPLGPVAQTSGNSCSFGDTNAFLAPAGPGIEGSLMVYVGVPLCDMPVNTFQLDDVQDPRICDADAADLKHAEPCYKAD